MTNLIVYDLQTYNKDRARHYSTSFYQLNRLAAKNNRDSNPEEVSRCKKDTLVFDGDICFGFALDNLLKLKDEERKISNTNVEYNCYLHANNGSGCDTRIILKSFPCNKRIVDITKIGKVYFS